MLHQRIIVRDLPVPLDEANEPTARLLRLVRQKLATKEIADLTIIRRALDARRRQPHFVYSVEVSAPSGLAARVVAEGKAEASLPMEIERWHLSGPPDGPPPVIVGTGPAGLFAGLLLAEAGWRPILLERGQAVEDRAHAVSRLYAHGELDPESNVCFGEGGAGTFSDGKLTTRVGDARVKQFMLRLVELGADADLLIDSRPHLGTDRLVVLLRTIRQRLLALGATVRFGARVDDLIIKDGTVAGVRLSDGEQLQARQVLLASGHSARDLFARLESVGLPLEARPLAMGFRIEHPQALINEIRYGRHAHHRALPAADYRLTHNVPGEPRRGVYSFCMCPGGVVVTTPTRPEELCINGMSHASRAGRFANSGLVVSITCADYHAAGFSGPLAGVHFQQAVEQAAYRVGGGVFRAPAARVTDFMTGRQSAELNKSSYRRGLVASDLCGLYPPVVIEALKEGLRQFDRKMPGFVSTDGQLIGVESRTSSPVRLPRDERLQAIGVAGLYPIGEGLGYGGGIVSAAVDGMRAAGAMLEEAGAVRQSVS